MKKIFAPIFALISILLIPMMPAFAEPILEGITGEKTPFSSLRGKWVIINYWASWCESCINEIPELNAFYQKHQSKNDLRLFAVNYDVLDVSEQLELIKKYRIQYPSLQTDPADLLELEDIAGVPVSFVFNPQGKHIKTLYGPQTLIQLDNLIKGSDLKKGPTPSPEKVVAAAPVSFEAP